MSPAIRKRLVQIGFLVLIQAVALFTSGWRWDWWNTWAYLGLYMVFLDSDIAIPLSFGSLWACIPFVLLVLTLFICTKHEVRTLQNELGGYKEYTRQVRNRLIPGIW